MTRLHSIDLCNVRRFSANASIHLGAGATILLAPNGSGKTAVFEAIEFGLTGRVARLGDDLAPLVRDQQDRLEVSLDFGDEVRKATLTRGSQPALFGGLPSVFGEAEAKDLPYLLRLTHLLEQRDREWLVSSASEVAGDQLSRLPIGRDAARASSVLAGARNGAGRAHTAALGNLATASRDIEDWRFLLAQRDRAVSPSDAPLIPLAEIRARLESLALMPWAGPIAIFENVASVGAGLAELSARLDRREQALRMLSASLSTLSPVVADYMEAGVRSAALRVELTQARAAVLTASSAVVSAVEAVEAKAQALAALDAARAKISEQQRLSDSLAATRAALAARRASLVGVVVQLAPAEATFANAQSLRQQAHQLSGAHAALRERGERLTEQRNVVAAADDGLAKWVAANDTVERLNEEAGQAAASLAKALAASVIAAELQERRRRELDDANETLAQASAVSDAVRAAVAMISEHLPAEHGDCPVCGVAHGSVELRRRISTAMRSIDPALVSATERLKRKAAAARAADAEAARLVAEIHGLRGQLSEIEQRGSVVSAVIAALRALPLLDQGAVEIAAAAVATRMAEIVSAQTELARELDTLAPEPSSEATTSLLAGLSAASAELDRVRGMIAETQVNCERVGDQVRRLEDDLLEAGGDDHIVERAAAAERAARESAALLDAARGAVAQWHDIRSGADGLVRRLEESTASNEERRRALLATWSSIPLHGAPSSEALATAQAAAETEAADGADARATVEELRAEIARWIAAETGQDAQRAVDRARGTESENVRTARLTLAVTAARSEVLQRTCAKEALESLAGHLASGLGDIHNQVVAPFIPRWQALLRRVVREQRFGEAELSFYSRRLKEHAEAKVPLHQGTVRVDDVASEAQSTDLQLTFLLSMALGHAWCPWRALLLDDPTQHHDLVHASAVFDVLRDYIAEHRFQVLLATHDALQARFFQRKLINDGIEVRVWTLQPQDGGVRAVEI